MVITEAILVAAQLTAQLARHHVDAGVEVLTAFLGTDHHPIGINSDLGSLLRHPGVARHGEMNISFFDQAFVMIDGTTELCFRVITDSRCDIEIAAVNQQLHG